MRLPWSRRNESAELKAQIAALRAEIDARPTANAVTENILRAAMTLSPAPQAIPQSGVPPYPLYNFDNPLWFAQSQAPSKRPGSAVDIRTLRRLADTYDVLRACIQHLKREVSAIPFQFVPKDEKDDRSTTKIQVDAMMEFCGKRGGLGGVGTSRAEFEAKMMEDLIVLGSSAVFYHPTRGGWPYEVVCVDASTIRPRVDAYGWPGPGEAAWEQWILGVRVAEFTRENMDYRGLPETVRTTTPYHMSPVELLIFVVESALRADQWNRAWLQDGNSASMIISMGDKDSNMTPDQIKTFMEIWDAMRSGNSNMRQKTAFLPAGSSVINDATRKDQDFQEFELWLLRRTCAIMGVQPASLGFAGEQYKVSQSDSMQSTSVFGTASYLDFRKSFYDDLCERFGYFDIEVRNITAREEQATERADRNIKLTGGVAVKTINEARQDEGLDPIEGGDTLLVPNSVVTIDNALAAAVMDSQGGDPAQVNSQQNGDAQRSALLQWERKAVNRVKSTGKASCRFESNAIPQGRRKFIEDRLGGCVHAAAVKELFRNAAQIDETEVIEVHDWAERVTRELNALANH